MFLKKPHKHSKFDKLDYMQHFLFEVGSPVSFTVRRWLLVLILMSFYHFAINSVRSINLETPAKMSS